MRLQGRHNKGIKGETKEGKWQSRMIPRKNGEKGSEQGMVKNLTYPRLEGRRK